jgi:hypothetical protein
MQFHRLKETIKDIIDRRLTAINAESKAGFPQVLKQRAPSWTSIANEKLIALAFVSPEDIDLSLSRAQEELEPFPGLYTTNNALPAALRFEKTTFSTVQGYSIANIHSFFIGEDSSFVVIDHTQTVLTRERGLLKYTIPLAYFIGFGTEMIPERAYEHLEELIVYSVKTWRETR